MGKMKVLVLGPQNMGQITSKNVHPIYLLAQSGLMNNEPIMSKYSGKL